MGKMKELFMYEQQRLEAEQAEAEYFESMYLRTLDRTIPPLRVRDPGDEHTETPKPTPTK